MGVNAQAHGKAAWNMALRGFQTGQGPIAVGVSATRAVVTSILLVILADAVFAAAGFVVDK